MKLKLLPLLAIVAGTLSGCVQRTLTVTSDPPGALVYLNDLEIGRTPVERDFTYYGWYDVQARKEGYDSLSTRKPVIAPWWQWPPFDLVAELMPFRPHDRKSINIVMSQSNPADSEPSSMMQRAESMKATLESSEFTKSASTQKAPKVPSTSDVPR